MWDLSGDVMKTPLSTALTRIEQLVPLVVTLLSIALLGAGMSHSWATPTVLSALAALGGVLSVLQFCLLRRRIANEHQAQLFLDRLGKQAFDTLPTIEPDSTWARSLAELQQVFETAQQRITEAEHGRTSADVRYRRALADYERASRVLAQVNEPLLAIDAYDEIQLSNRAAEELLGLPHEGAPRRTLAALQRCERLVALVKDAQRRQVASSRTEDFELETPRGSKRWYSATATNLAKETAEAEAGGGGVVLQLHDISAQKEIQKQHAEFVSSASHEMKAPLAGIRAYVELLSDGEVEDPETREEFLGVINNQADRLQRLVENLLNIARIEAGVVKVHKQSQGLNEVLVEAFNVMQPTAAGKNITITHELSQMYLGALMDRDLMLQAVINLVSNAIKYTHPGGRVTIRSHLLDDQVQFEVEDTGVGLSDEDCQKIFDKFYRVEKDQNMAAGTGLGLSLAKYIVEDVHGGKLALRSKLGEGSTFSVTVPVAHRAN